MARKNDTKGTVAPPKVEDELQKILGAFMAHKKLPDFIPPAPIDAAKWWMDMQEPAKHEEHPRQASVPGNDEARRWICPYHERILATLRNFLGMPIKDQKIIIAAREDGIFWRGESMHFFMRVISETERMRKMGVGDYRKEASDNFRKMTRSKMIRQ